MALRERNVVGILVDGDGTPITSGKITFKPTQPLGYTSTHVIVDRVIQITTNAATGEFTASLWVDEDSLTPVDYTVTFPVANAGDADSGHTATISLSYEDGSDKNIGTLIAETTPNEELPTDTLGSIFDALFGASLLSDLFDVNLTAIADGDSLVWDSATSKFVNSAVGGGGGGTPGGADTQIQFNDGGAFGGDASFAWDKTNNVLTLNHKITTTDTELILEQTGDTLGDSRIRVRNRVGANGALFENDSIAIVDLGFKETTGGIQNNFRMEGRSAFTLSDNSPYGEFQFLTLGGEIWMQSGKSRTNIAIGYFGVGTSALTSRFSVQSQSATEVAQIIKLAAAQTGDALQVLASDTTPLAKINSYGAGNFTGLKVMYSNLVGVQLLDVGVSQFGTKVLAYDASNVPFAVKMAASPTVNGFEVQNSSNSPLFLVNKDGAFATKANSAPADGDISAGQMFIWFDSTNGSAKLKVKAKQADGTVKTGEIALA